MAARLAALLLAVAALTLVACGGDGGGGGSAPNTTGGGGATQSAQLGTPEVVATGLQVPWGLAWLPDGDLLVSERTTGRILRVPKAGGKPVVAKQLPGVDRNIGEGGLLGIAVSPDYARDKQVYAYYTGTQDNRVVHFSLAGNEKPIVTGIYRSTNHDGGRIAFGPDGKLYITTGDGLDPSRSQDPNNPGGKILRINPDGSIPSDNPVPGNPYWTLGHRNVQGLAWDSKGRLWESELGNNAWDELNLIRPGKNYGWPEVEGMGDDSSFVNPLAVWRPADMSPSGIAVGPDGAVYIAALRGQSVWRVPITAEGTAGKPARHLQGTYGRIRDIRFVDGRAWVLTSNGSTDRIVSLPASDLGVTG
jgi:glucose/arabinose dehydrogenase